LPSNTPQPANRESRIVSSQRFSVGPLPDGDAFALYPPEVQAAIVEDFRERAAHEREMDRRAMALDEMMAPKLATTDRLGATYGFVLALAATIGAITVALLTRDAKLTGALATVVGALSLPGLVRAFRQGKKPSESPLKEDE